jgi:hypothetical protein
MEAKTNPTVKLNFIVTYNSRLRHYATSPNVAGSLPHVVGFVLSISLILSGRTMALESLTEMSSRNLSGGKERLTRKAHKLAAICEPTVYKLWEPGRLTSLQASTVCYWDSFFSL